MEGERRPTHHTFTDKELEECVNIAKERNRRSEGEYCFNSKPTLERDIVHFAGVIGELAFLRMFDLPLDGWRDTRPRSTIGGTDTFDAKVNGHTVDVKTIKYDSEEKSTLSVAAYKKAQPADIYALIEYTTCEKTARLIGTFPGNELFQEKPQMDNDFFHYLISRERLLTWNETMRRINEVAAAND